MEILKSKLSRAQATSMTFSRYHKETNTTTTISKPYIRTQKASHCVERLMVCLVRWDDFGGRFSMKITKYDKSTYI